MEILNVKRKINNNIVYYYSHIIYYLFSYYLFSYNFIIIDGVNNRLIFMKINNKLDHNCNFKGIFYK